MAKKRGVDRNKNRQKYKTPEARQQVFLLFCDHLAEGNSPKTFLHCAENTVMKMMRDYPEEFDEETYEIAKASGRLYWEKIGKLGTLGKIKGFNANLWWRIVRNKGVYTPFRKRDQEKRDKERLEAFKDKLRRELGID